MKEPSLYTLAKKSNGGQTECYRFLWLRTFDRPVAVRVEKMEDAKPHLFVRELSGKGGHSPGKLTITKDKVLTDDEWSHIVKSIAQCGFWEMPTVERQHGTVVTVTTDGADWVMEGARGDKYHVVDRNSPTSKETAKYRETCLDFLKLSGIPLGEIY